MQNKLSLDLDALAVDTFDTAPDAAHARGTVRGNDSVELTATGCDTLVQTTTDPNQNCMCYSTRPCIATLETVCGTECEV